MWIEIGYKAKMYRLCFVTPCAGVWIEINITEVENVVDTGHSLCGSVD